MAFNPFKRQVEAPIDYSQDNQSESNNQNNEFAPEEQQEPPLSYEGSDIKELENSGLNTDNLLKAPKTNTTNNNERTRFNVPLLEALPLAFVLEQLGFEKVKDNHYRFHDDEITLKDNKWYNTFRKVGNINAISLVKELIAIERDLNVAANQKFLFIEACKQLSSIQEIVQNQGLIVEKELPDNKDKTENGPGKKQEPVSTYEASEAAKNAQKPKSDINWEALTKWLDSIPLSSVMEFIGANPNEDGHRGKWKIWKTWHNVQVNGQKWKNWNSDEGGIGGISLMAEFIGHEQNIDYRIKENRKSLRSLAIKALMKEFGTDYQVGEFDDLDTPDFKVPFAMPHVIDFKLNAVRQYLNEKRGLPLWIINKQIKAGSLFAGSPSDWKEDPDLKDPEKLTNDRVWSIFLAVNGNAAEMRAIERTDQFAKLLAKGSDKEMGGFLIKAEKTHNERTITALEAAIDTMSYHAFYPGRIATSCMGVNFNLAVKAAIEGLDNGYKFQLGFDNDLAGNEAAVRFREQLIGEIGEEDYLNYYKEGKIGYFDLGIQCLLQTIKKGGIFYFDAKNNDIGKDATKMFQAQLFKIVPKDDVNKLIANGKIRYLNVAPNYGLIKDVEKEAEQVLSLLNSNKPYYLVLKSDDDEPEQVRVKREAFEDAFFRLAQDSRAQFEKDGRLIYKKQALAKDWNEYFVVMKKDPKFQQRLAQLEEMHASYNEEEKVVVAKKTRKP